MKLTFASMLAVAVIATLGIFTAASAHAAAGAIGPADLASLAPMAAIGLGGLAHAALAVLPAPIELKGEEDDPTNVVTKALGDLTKTVDDRFKDLERKADTTELKTDLTKLGQRLDKIEAKTSRPGGTGENDPAEPTIQRKAFVSFVRLGEQRMPVEEAKSLIVGEDTRGGYLAPSEFSTEMLKNIVQFSPVRQAARVGSTASKSVILPKRTGTPTAQWVTETQNRPETAPTYGQEEIAIFEAAAYIDVSLQLLEDSAIDIEAELNMDFAEEFGRLEGVAFVTGDGVNKPEGFLSNSSVAESISGSAATIADANGQANGIIDAFYALKPFYRNRSTWMMNGTTMASVRKLKDSNGAYLWQPGIAAGEPPTLLGRPVVEAVDMPNEGAGNIPIVLGDFMAAYRIYDRVGISVLRDPYSQATAGLVRFHGRRRVGGKVVLAEALRKIKCASS